MMRRLVRRREERGAETVAMLFVIPVMVILVFALLDVGMMFRNRMLVENVARDAVRGAAADGGVLTTRTSGTDWEQYARDRLMDSSGNCRIGQCDAGAHPLVDCSGNDRPGTAGMISAQTGQWYPGNTVQFAGDTITCIVEYPYKPINGPLLNSPMGLGMGGLLKDFKVSVTARSETGDQSIFG